ncbi:NAD(+)--rifampin ADP-ribosyltransferase [Pseudarthrobacter sp. MDT3-9]|nr:NAD(+)--rifampin ADP-ribosyltransferase [Pseudarthrobacter sp. MDT3-9]MCO4253494.1 NAD(+)--rifampin ADP-ribosyltransferase [Pseudarthrobacter sp. MDT3-9]
MGEGPGRIYRVEPTGPFEDDPNLTDKKFPGNPTRSYRTQEPLRVVDEILDWQPHSPPRGFRTSGTTLKNSNGWASRQSTELPRSPAGAQ